MPFDFGFNYRASSGFVTDGSYAAPALGEAYPHTYTNADGKSINAGWTTTPIYYKEDSSATNDPRIAGINDCTNNVANYFSIDLSSGSAPGAGTYMIDCAFGYALAQERVDFEIRDTATVLIDGRNGGAGITTTAAGKFIDATLAVVTASTTWTGTPVSKTFATQLCVVACALDNVSGGNTDTPLAHFRLTLQAGAALSLAVDPLLINAGLSDVDLTLTPAPTATGGSLLLLGLQFARAGTGTAQSLSVDPLVVQIALPDVTLTSSQPQSLSLAVDPLTIRLTLPDVTFTTTQPQALALGVDPLTISLGLGDVGLQLGPQKLTVLVDPLAVTVLLGDVVLAVEPFTPPRTPFLPSGLHPYLEYRRHRRMGR